MNRCFAGWRNKLIWHKHDGIENIQNGDVKKRPFLYPTPVLRQDISKYLDYPVNSDMGVSIYLAICHKYKNSDYPELLAKQACWTIKHLCERTDMVDCGVPLRLGITTDIKKIALPYLNACNFPMPKIDWFDSREDKYPYSAKIDAMRQPGFKNVKKVFHIDICMMFKSTSIPLFTNIRSRWTSKPIAVDKAILRSRNDGSGVNPLTQELQKNDERWKNVADFCGITVKQAKHYWRYSDPFYIISGQVFGITRDLLCTSEWFLLDQAIQIGCSDEVALTLYCYKKKWTNKDIDIIGKTPNFVWTTWDVPDRTGINIDYWLSLHHQ